MNDLHIVKPRNQYTFWICAFVLLVILFSASMKSLTLAFFFVSFLFPVILGTSFYFNQYLVPRFLLTERRIKLVLYTFYMLVISIYLELIVMYISLVVLADFNFENLGSYAGDIRLLIVVLYLIVFSNGMLVVFNKLKERTAHIEQLLNDKTTNEQELITVRADRKNVPLRIEEIGLIESLSDYVKIHYNEDVIITREKISKLEEMLPESFIRIHRSYLVNKGQIKSFSREMVMIGEQKFPLGRKYQKQALNLLKGDSNEI